MTSCLCKIMERMINDRLVWYLESNGLISNLQCRFRSKRCTTDYLVHLETVIREAFIRNEHLAAIFFDLEKAYDITWKHGIMRDLRDLGLKGRLSHFTSGFLSDRKFKVHIGSTLSDMKNQEEGVFQGSVLSVTLFSIKINNITKCLTPGVDRSLYVVDHLICYRSKYIHTIECKLQKCLDKLNKWATENGFRFSLTKNKCVCFCHKRKLHNDPCLKLERQEIPVVNEHKFLGLVFNKKLTFIPHLKYLSSSWKKRL